MGMEHGIPRRGARASVNVTPLIDVVLVLLIIFMVLSPSTLKHMPAAVPKAKAPTDAIVEPPLVLAYTARRELTINREAVALDALASAIASRLRFDRQKVAFFQVEDEVNYGETVRLMDTVRGAGAKVLAVAPRN